MFTALRGRWHRLLDRWFAMAPPVRPPVFGSVFDYPLARRRPRPPTG